jgi:hypothetical protein
VGPCFDGSILRNCSSNGLVLSSFGAEPELSQAVLCSEDVMDGS